MMERTTCEAARNTNKYRPSKYNKSMSAPLVYSIVFIAKYRLLEHLQVISISLHHLVLCI